MVIMLSSKLKLVWIFPNIQNKLNIPGQKLTARKDTKSVSEIILDNPMMDIDQGTVIYPILVVSDFGMCKCLFAVMQVSQQAIIIRLGSSQCLTLAQFTWPPLQQTSTAPRPAIPPVNVEDLVAVLERKRKW